MAINKNHEFEDLDGIKCAIVQKNASAQRAAFLKEILNYNGYTVVVVATPVAPAKPVPVTAATAPAATVAESPVPSQPPPATYTIGVTDLTFNPTNAIFGRSLKTPTGHIVTLAYWNQKEKESHDEIPYYESIA